MSDQDRPDHVGAAVMLAAAAAKYVVWTAHCDIEHCDLYVGPNNYQANKSAATHEDTTGHEVSVTLSYT